MHESIAIAKKTARAETFPVQSSGLWGVGVVFGSCPGSGLRSTGSNRQWWLYVFPCCYFFLGVSVCSWMSAVLPLKCWTLLVPRLLVMMQV